jgi:hypothetical protein
MAPWLPILEGEKNCWPNCVERQGRISMDGQASILLGPAVGTATNITFTACDVCDWALATGRRRPLTQLARGCDGDA